MYPHWFWRIRFRTAAGPGETIVVAPHRAGAKQAIGTPATDVTTYENAEPGERVPDEMAAQRFDGYYPGVRSAIAAVRND